LETKIEYQLSTELAETLAVEQAILMASTSSHKSWLERWMLPIIFGFFTAALFALGNYSSELKTADFSWPNTITAAIVGLAIGLFYSWVGQMFYYNYKRKRGLNLIKKQGRIFHDRFGSTRIVSWDSESFTVSTEKSRSEIKWQTIDRFVNGENNIHAFFGNQIALSIPKAALPQNLRADELIKLWESYLLKKTTLS
jgi:YcxB-like protein